MLSALEKLETKNQENFTDITKRMSDDSLFNDIRDADIFEQVKKYIINQDYLRTDYQVFQRFEWFGQDKNFLVVETKFSYNVCNLKDKTTKYEFRFFLEKELETAEIKDIGYKVINNTGKVEKHEKFEDLKNEIIIDNNSPDMIIFNKTIEIPDKGKLYCYFATETTAHSKDSFPIICLQNTKNLEVHITHHPEDLIIEAFAIHPDIEKFQNMINDRNTKVWKIQAALLPGQGIIIYTKQKTT